MRSQKLHNQDKNNPNMIVMRSQILHNQDKNNPNMNYQAT